MVDAVVHFEALTCDLPIWEPHHSRIVDEKVNSGKGNIFYKLFDAWEVTQVQELFTNFSNFGLGWLDLMDELLWFFCIACPYQDWAAPLCEGFHSLQANPRVAASDNGKLTSQVRERPMVLRPAEIAITEVKDDQGSTNSQNKKTDVLHELWLVKFNNIICPMTVYLQFVSVWLIIQWGHLGWFMLVL